MKSRYWVRDLVIIKKRKTCIMSASSFQHITLGFCIRFSIQTEANLDCEMFAERLIRYGIEEGGEKGIEGNCFM